MLCGDGARSWDSGRRADVVGGPWDASLVVPGLERRPRRGPDACSMAWRCGPRAARCGPRGRAGASRGRRARVPARGSRHTHGFSAKPALPRRRRRGRARGPRVARERVAAMASSRDHAAAAPSTWSRERRVASQVPDSVLLVVQSYPVSSLAHDQVMHRLRSAKWPVTLRFSRPLTDNDVTPLARCLQLEQQGELPDDLKLQMLKRLLSKGVAVKKHGSRTVWKSNFTARSC